MGKGRHARRDIDARKRHGAQRQPDDLVGQQHNGGVDGENFVLRHVRLSPGNHAKGLGDAARGVATEADRRHAGQEEGADCRVEHDELEKQSGEAAQNSNPDAHCAPRREKGTPTMERKLVQGGKRLAGRVTPPELRRP